MCAGAVVVRVENVRRRVRSSHNTASLGFPFRARSSQQAVDGDWVGRGSKRQRGKAELDSPAEEKCHLNQLDEQSPVVAVHQFLWVATVLLENAEEELCVGHWNPPLVAGPETSSFPDG